MNDLIKDFIQKQKCASICCIGANNNPYCFSSFYAFNAEEDLLYFKSSADTNHIKFIIENPIVAGTILPDKLQALSVKGIQFKGVVLHQHISTTEASFHYQKKYPFALAMAGEVWTIQLTYIKMTDSSQGFGKKIIWEKESAVVK